MIFWKVFKNRINLENTPELYCSIKTHCHKWKKLKKTPTKTRISLSPSPNMHYNSQFCLIPKFKKKRRNTHTKCTCLFSVFFYPTKLTTSMKIWNIYLVFLTTKWSTFWYWDFLLIFWIAFRPTFVIDRSISGEIWVLIR